MSQTMPDFDPGPAGLELPSPKKPRRKPTKKSPVKAHNLPKPKSTKKARRRRKVVPSRKHEPESLHLAMLLNLFLKVKILLEPLTRAERQSLLKIIMSEP